MPNRFLSDAVSISLLVVCKDVEFSIKASQFYSFQGEIDQLQACVFSTDGALIVSGASTLCFETPKKKKEDVNDNKDGEDNNALNVGLGGNSSAQSTGT